VFAIRYQSTLDNSNYILIDNFNIENFEPLTYSFSDSTEYFTFHTSLENGEVYWNEISEDLDNWYLELCSYWDRPGITPIFNAEKKTKIYLLAPAIFAEQSETELPDWKCGFHKNESSFITKLPTGENSLYENSYLNLAKNTLGQFILKKHFNGYCQEYFSEGFGLFYTGYQPERDSILHALNDLGNEPTIEMLKNTSQISTTYQKHL
jgi:hypothetical protein